VYAFTAYDITKRNYDFGRNSPNMEVIGLNNAISNRSIGASFNWDNLKSKIVNPLLFNYEHMPDICLDVLFKPNEVLKSKKD